MPPNEKPPFFLSSSAGLDPNILDELFDPNENPEELVLLCPKPDVDGGPKVRDSAGLSLLSTLPLVSIRVGLSSIAMSLSSCVFGGVVCFVDVLPNMNGVLVEEMPAGSAGFVGVPKLKPDPVVAPNPPPKLGFESAASGGVAGGAPKVNGLFAASACAGGAEPNENPEEPVFDPPNGFLGGSLDPDDAGGAPKANGDVGGAAFVCEDDAEMIGALKGRVGSGVLDLLFVEDAPKVKNEGDGEGAGLSALDEDSVGFGWSNGVKPDGVEGAGVGMNVDDEAPIDPNDGALEGLCSSAGVDSAGG